MSVVSQVILQADDELRYPTSGELQSIKDFFQTGMQRTRIAATLTENEKRIIDDASKELWKIHPEYIANGGNAAGGRERSNQSGSSARGKCTTPSAFRCRAWSMRSSA
jgi:allophycocyanin-B